MNSQMQTTSPQQQILKYMQAGGKLTVQKAYAEFGTTELRKTVSRLRRAGVEVKSKPVQINTVDGRRQQVNEYFIEEKGKEVCSIPEDIYMQVARYILENNVYECGRNNIRSYTFSFDDERFESDSGDGFVELAITGVGTLHYRLNAEQWGTEEVFDSFGSVYLECHTYNEEGSEVLNDFNINKLSTYIH